MWVGLFLATILIASTSFTWLPQTPKGVQCPTAAVQVVTAVAYVRDCCGKLVAKTFQHTPREGEPGFKQCRCAEKKAAEHQQKTDSVHSSRSTLIVAVLNPRLEFRGWALLQLEPQAHFYTPLSHALPAFAPPTPPPQLV